MSTPEQHEPPVESRSSVQIEMDSKGLAKVRVKVYAGEDPTAVDEARALAVRTYTAAKAAVS